MWNAFRSGHWPTLVGAWLHFEVSFMVWLLIGALSVPIASEFGLTATQKGVLVAVPLLGGAVFRIAVGLGSDWYGPKAIGLLLLTSELAAVVWGWVGAGSYGQLLAVGLLLGVAGASFAVALPIASRVYPPAHQGFAMGVAASANSGTVLSMFFAPRLSQHVGWHGVFGLMIVPLLFTALLFLLLVRKDHPGSRFERPPKWWRTFVDMLRRPSMHWLCLLYAVTFGGFVGFCSVLPIFLHDQYALDMVTAGSLTALCGLLGSLVRPLGGYVADRVGGLHILSSIFFIIAACVAVVGQLPALPWATASLVCAVTVMGFGNGVVFQMVSDRFQKQIGLASGLIGASGGFGGFFLPMWLGLLKDVTGTFQTGLWLFAAVAAAAGLSVAGIGRRFSR